MAASWWEGLVKAFIGGRNFGERRLVKALLGFVWWITWMLVTFVLNALPLELKRQADLRSTPSVTHGWFAYPDAYMYVAAACVATIATIMIDWPAKTRRWPTAIRVFILLLDVAVLADASANYGGTLSFKLLAQSDITYVQWLLGAALLCAAVAVLPARIADSFSPPPPGSR